MNKAGKGDGIPAELESDESKSAAFNMPTDMENSAVATGLENVSLHLNPKERQWRKGKIYPSECRVPKNSKKR